jgi:hypothetical protein
MFLSKGISVKGEIIRVFHTLETDVIKEVLQRLREEVMIKPQAPSPRVKNNEPNEVQ